MKLFDARFTFAVHSDHLPSPSSHHGESHLFFTSHGDVLRLTRDKARSTSQEWETVGTWGKFESGGAWVEFDSSSFRNDVAVAFLQGRGVSCWMASPNRPSCPVYKQSLYGPMPKVEAFKAKVSRSEWTGFVTRAASHRAILAGKRLDSRSNTLAKVRRERAALTTRFAALAARSNTPEEKARRAKALQRALEADAKRAKGTP